jgi:nitrite reductase/ring-hydroxylating ferredoxin subunit
MSSTIRLQIFGALRGIRPDAFDGRGEGSRPQARQRPRRPPVLACFEPFSFILRADLMEEFAMADNGQNAARVCAQADVPPGSVKAFTVGPNTLAVYNIDGAYYITDDECTHAAASLADGMLEGEVIECCMHMGSFHVPTGNVIAPPCEVPLRTYKVVLEGDDVLVDLAHNAAGEPQLFPSISTE